MNNILLVALREFRQITRMRSFWLTLLILPAALAFAPLTQRFMGESDADKVMIIDQDGGTAGHEIAKRLQLDDDRRTILEDELRAEERKLADLKRDFNNGEPERQGNEKNYAKYQERVAQMRDDISRSEKNIEALRREIANIR